MCQIIAKFMHQMLIIYISYDWKINIVALPFYLIMSSSTRLHLDPSWHFEQTLLGNQNYVPTIQKITLTTNHARPCFFV